MTAPDRCTLLLLAALCLPFAACDRSATAKNDQAPNPAATAPAPAEPGGMKRITLKDIESKRLGIVHEEVTMVGDRLSMPYSALVYDPSGHEWAFASPETNVYLRTALKVAAIEGDKVYLAEGPAVGTKVVTHGAAELYGIEFGVGK